MYIWTYGLRKTGLEKCLKCHFSENHSTGNMVNGLKHCSKLKDSTFTIFIDSCAWNSGWERVSKWYSKSQNFLLALWLLITSILFLIEIIYSSIFRRNYLRNEKYLLNFFLLSVNLDSILKTCKKKVTVIVDVFWTDGLRNTG